MSTVNEPERTFIDESGVAWIRSGHCSDCGECCVGDWSPEIVGERREVEGMCGAWTADRGDGCSGCILHQLRAKPKMCVDFPWHPSQIGDRTNKPSCTYTFRKA